MEWFMEGLSIIRNDLYAVKGPHRKSAMNTPMPPSLVSSPAGGQWSRYIGGGILLRWRRRVRAECQHGRSAVELPDRRLGAVLARCGERDGFCRSHGWQRVRLRPRKRPTLTEPGPRSNGSNPDPSLVGRHRTNRESPARRIQAESAIVSVVGDSTQ